MNALKRPPKHIAKEIKKLSKNNVNPLDAYLRVATNYFKKIVEKDRYGIYRIYLISWNRQEIVVDHSKDILKSIPKFDKFVSQPSYKNYEQLIGKAYNTFNPIYFKPRKGKWSNIRLFLKHIFGEQTKIGIQYFQALYLHPHRILPILVLVSAKRHTGKTTFINFLMAMFGNNVVLLNSDMLRSPFNYSYITKKIAAIDEAYLNNEGLIEKIKFLSTAQNATVSRKYHDDYNVQCHLKIVMTSNKENDFIKVESEEIRYFVRKLSEPKYHDSNILEKMIEEIPAFLYHLEQQNPLDWSKSRQLFTVGQLDNSFLNRVKDSSISYCHFEILEAFEYYFNNDAGGAEFIEADLTHIKNKLFSNNNKIERSDIARVLRDDLGISPSSKSVRYKPFNSDKSKIGRVYRIHRSKIFQRK